jgi:diadenosine tetraphosphate (Ap4A) HIT family hydrolase
MLERLVTTLLSLDYLNQKPEVSLAYHKHQSLARMPSRCRSSSLSSSSLSSTESADSQSSTNHSSSSSSSNNNNNKKNRSTVPQEQQPMYEYHCPPKGVNYDNNDTVFGAILRGELPAVTLAESSRLVAIQDIKPRAPLHALIIPKAFVGSVFDIAQQDDDWFQEMKMMALELVRTQHPGAYSSGDYRLCFHIPPFNSVDHLHLHVLAPLSQMTWYYRYIKYNPHTRWCIEMGTVCDRLAKNQSPVPYRRPTTCKPQKETIIIVEEKCKSPQTCLPDDTADSDADEDDRATASSE